MMEETVRQIWVNASCTLQTMRVGEITCVLNFYSIMTTAVKTCLALVQVGVKTHIQCSFGIIPHMQRTADMLVNDSIYKYVAP